MTQVLGVAWYRFRATLTSRLGAYFGVVLLIGLIGGIAMTSVQAARRTQSSYPTFLASTNPSDLGVSVWGPTGGPLPPLTTRIERLPEVSRVREVAEPINLLPLAANGGLSPVAGLGQQVLPLSSLDGEFIAQDRPAITEGRMLAPGRAEAVMSASTAAAFGAHVGQVLATGLFTPAQEASPGFGTPAVRPRMRVNIRLVGIAVFNNQVVQDDVDRSYGFVLLSPAVLRETAAVLPLTAATFTYELQLRHGAADVPAVEQDVLRMAPSGANVEFHVTARVVTEAELALRPESVALGGFGAIAGLVCLIVGAQALSRQLRSWEEERSVLRALGASPTLTLSDGLIGALSSVMLGALLAAGLCIAMSPLSPLGPVRAVYPSRGVALDWTVLGSGLGALVVVLGGIAIALAYHRAPHRLGADQQPALRTSSIAWRAEAAGMPLVAVAGLRFALEPGRGRTAVPARSALVGAVVAVAVVVGALTFASSLQTLVSHPHLYGWNWDYALEPSNSMPPQALRLLDHDPEVADWSGYDYGNFEIGGQAVPVLLSRGPTEVLSPPVLSGHGLRGAGQVVIGAATLAALHAHVNGTVQVGYGTPATAPLYMPPTTMRVVGTATFPTIGWASVTEDHTSMGTGAMLSEADFPPAFRALITGNKDPDLTGPSLVFVRLRPGVSPSAGRANLQRVANAADRIFATDRNPQAQGNSVVVLGVQRPAQIVNYRTIGATPVVLAVGLAAGAVVALGLVLNASVRGRRRDFALLKTLGFTEGQVAAAVAWQSTVAAIIGLLGIPLGIVFGRQLWTLFARNINAVPDPTVPAWSVVLAAVCALGFANLVAALPGRSAARTPTALVLRSE